MAKQERYPFPIQKFGGLRLDAEADEVGLGGCIDCLNVDFDKRGAVRTRDGSAKFNSVAGASNFFAIDCIGGAYVIASDTGNNLRAYSSAGTLIASVASTDVYNVSVASLGTAAAGPYYYTGGNDSQQIRRFDPTGSAWTSPAGMPNGRYLAVQPADNRLVAAHTGTGQTSRVKFSGAGTPETWGANDFVDLYPNDGEVIVGMVAWQEKLFVFKQSRFFTFYGNTTDGSGNPIFNYRAVQTGGIAGQTFGVCATARGVYFADAAGMYRTTGGPPVKISDPLEPLFATTVDHPFFATADEVRTVGRPTAIGGRVLFPVELRLDGVDVAAGVFVYYEDAETWSFWNGLIGFPTPSSKGFGPMAVIRRSGESPELVYLRATSTSLYKMDPTLTVDDSTAIASRYRSGSYTVGNDPSQEATVVQTIMDGIGSPSFSVARDFATSLPTTGGGAKATVTLGTSPAYAQGRHMKAQRGRRFSYQIESTSGAWRVDSLTHHVRGVRDSGLKTA